MKKLICLLLSFFILCTLGGCRKNGAASGSEPVSGAAELHVSPSGSDKSGDGSRNAPYETVGHALSLVQPGQTVVLHEGTYAPFAVEVSGTQAAPLLICAADGERAVIGGSGEMPAIEVTDAEYLTLRGLEVCGGVIGIGIYSSKERGDTPLRQIAVEQCTVHGIRGTHGICVYGENDLAPIRELRVTGCEVYDCCCGDSEAVVLNGNINGFEISGNRIYDCDNIGIDLIGFEGTAAHARGDDRYENDFVQNGRCFDNVVYNISAEGNGAYLEEDGYDLCAGGIYIDGGQRIEVDHNFVFCCDIGIEVATERCAADDPLFCVREVSVHNNLICGCTGFAGLSFGGYDADRGLTEQCSFCHNTVIDCAVQLCVQRSCENVIEGNLFAGACGLAFNDDCPSAELENVFGGNLWCGADADALFADVPQALMMQLAGQTVTEERSVLSGLVSAKEGFGADFVPQDADAALYFAHGQDGRP